MSDNSERRLLVAVVDDEDAMREVLEMRLQRWDFDVCLAADGEEASRMVQERNPDIILSDIVLPELSGLDLFDRLRASGDGRAIVLMTAYGDVDMAVEAMKKGARDFLTKPLDYEKLRSILSHIREDVRDRSQSERLWAELDEGPGLGDLIGASPRMKEVFRLIELVAVSDASAIITGESGTGKEVAARTIHDLSPRASAPFVAINAAALPESLIESEIFGHEKGAFTGATASRKGCFEIADGGTLFLDEISEMPIELQPKLLRVLEQGILRRLGGSKEIRTDVRVLAATNRDPGWAVEANRLREDLYYRLNVFTVTLPPLRERAADIPLLSQHFVGFFSEKHGVDIEGVRDAAMERLRAYPWPGNVRELRNVLERATVVARGRWIEESDLPPFVRESGTGEEPELRIPVGITAAEAEKRLILKTLEHVENNKAEAARRLGLDVKTIRNKLKAWGLK